MKQIFIHGLGQTPDSWDKVLSYFPDSDECVCPDLVKMVSGKEASYGALYSAFSEECSRYDTPLNLCGLSLGGVLALNYAVEHPEKINSLILIAAQYKMPKNLLRFQNIIFRLTPKSMFREMGFGKSDFLTLCKTMAELDFSDKIAGIACPTLIICGEKDTANKKAALDMSKLIENSELHIIEKAGHEVNVEAPERLAEIVRSYYQRLRKAV